MKSRYFAATLLAGAAFASGAQAQCGPFPQNVYLGSLTHQQVSDYVTRAHGGDWSPYVATFESHLGKLMAIEERGSGITIKFKGESMTLSGARLARYIDVLEQRLEIARCLARSGEATMVAALNDFATAAGGDAPAAKAAPENNAGTATNAAAVSVTRPQTAPAAQAPQPGETTQVAAATQVMPSVRVELQNTGSSLTPLGVEVAASCVGGDTVFRLTNTGEAWPDQGKFALYRIDGDQHQMVSARRMRLNQGQNASFKVKAKHNPTGRIGLFVEPLWYQRPFKLDAVASCR